MRRVTWNLAAVVVPCCWLLSGCGVGEAKLTESPVPEEDASAPLPVQTAVAYRSDIFATFETTATIDADAEAPVPARVGGEVVEIAVEEGDHVVAGDVLARLDGERLKLQLQQAKAKLDMTTRELERLGRLQKRGLVSAAGVESLQFEQEALAASFELMQLNYNYTIIRAPIDGVISARDIKLGTNVNAGETTFRITGLSKLVVHLLIPQTELSRISAGNEANVRVDALPDQRFSATIARISPTIDSSNGTFRATAYIDNGDGRLAPGMFGRFSIAYEKHVAAVLVPAGAVLREDNENVVYVVKDGSATRRPVQLGIETNGEVEIVGGLDESESVVVAGQGSLRDGSKVMASNATDQAAG